MAQQYSNWLRIGGTLGQRAAFLIDALREHPHRNWDRLKLQVEPETREEEEGFLHFDSHGFPRGLGALMRDHLEVTLHCDFCDLSLPERRTMTLRANVVLGESSVQGEERIFHEPSSPCDASFDDPQTGEDHGMASTPTEGLEGVEECILRIADALKELEDLEPLTALSSAGGGTDAEEQLADESKGTGRNGTEALAKAVRIVVVSQGEAALEFVSASGHVIVRQPIARGCLACLPIEAFCSILASDHAINTDGGALCPAV